MSDAGDEETVDERDSARGWLVVAAAFLALTLTWGTLYTFSVFSDALAAEFGLSTFRTTTLYSVEVLAFFGVGGTASILLSAVRIRRVAAVGVALLALAVGAFQVVGGYWGVAAVFLVFGSVFGTLYVVILSVVPQWFDRHQGLAMGLVVTGNGVGLQALPFVWRRLLSTVGVRRAFLLVGAGLVLTYAALAVVFRRPRHASASAPELDREWLAWVVRQRQFWYAFAGVGLLWAWYHVYASHAVRMMTEAGLPQGSAAAVFGFVGGISIPVRVASGYVADRVGLRRTLTVCTLLVAVGFLVFLGRADRPALYVAILAFGVGLGSQAALYSPVVINTFGPRNATASMGLFTYAVGVSAFLAPLLVSSLHGVTGDYRSTLLLTALLTGLGALCIWVGSRGRVLRSTP